MAVDRRPLLLTFFRQGEDLGRFEVDGGAMDQCRARLLARLASDLSAGEPRADEGGQRLLARVTELCIALQELQELGCAAHGQLEMQRLARIPRVDLQRPNDPRTLRAVRVVDQN